MIRSGFGFKLWKGPIGCDRNNSLRYKLFMCTPSVQVEKKLDPRAHGIIAPRDIGGVIDVFRCRPNRLVKH